MLLRTWASLWGQRFSREELAAEIGALVQELKILVGERRPGGTLFSHSEEESRSVGVLVAEAAHPICPGPSTMGT